MVKLTISARPSRASQLRVLRQTLSAALHIQMNFSVRHPVWILVNIALADLEGEEICVSDLQEALAISQAASSRLAATAVKHRLIEAYHSPTDRRKSCVRLTRKGRAYVDEVLNAMRLAVEQERRRQAAEESA
jgi:DNA-binding MarR family transcriptional regulator